MNAEDILEKELVDMGEAFELSKTEKEDMSFTIVKTHSKSARGLAKKANSYFPSKEEINVLLKKLEKVKKLDKARKEKCNQVILDDLKEQFNCKLTQYKYGK